MPVGGATHPVVLGDEPRTVAGPDNPPHREVPTAVFVGVGNPFWGIGRTQLVIGATGDVRVSTFTRTTVADDVVAIDPLEASRIVTRFWRAAFTTRRAEAVERQPDEPTYLIELRRAGECLDRLYLTRSQVEASCELCELRDELAALCGSLGPRRHAL